MKLTEVLDAMDDDAQGEYCAEYDGGMLSLRAVGDDETEYRLDRCRTQGDRSWRPVGDRWWRLAAANGDFAGLTFALTDSAPEVL